MGWRKDLKAVADFLLDCFFPPACAFCGKVTELHNGICLNCTEAAIRVEPPYCEICGLNKKECQCKSKNVFYTALVAPFIYEGVVKEGIHRYKFREYDQNAKAYAHFMAEEIRCRYGENLPFDFIVSVPLHFKDKRKRDYDHGALLAAGVAKELGLVYDETVLVKFYQTKRQHDISRFYRKGNLAGVFDVTEPEKVKGKHILLVDDVVTTGESLNECAKMLYLYGAESVVCLVMARTKKKENKAAEEDESVEET